MWKRWKQGWKQVHQGRSEEPHAKAAWALCVWKGMFLDGMCGIANHSQPTMIQNTHAHGSEGVPARITSSLPLQRLPQGSAGGGKSIRWTGPDGTLEGEPASPVSVASTPETSTWQPLVKKLDWTGWGSLGRESAHGLSSLAVPARAVYHASGPFCSPGSRGPRLRACQTSGRVRAVVRPQVESGQVRPQIESGQVRPQELG